LVSENLSHHLSEIAGILFFLLGAMVIVELIDAHDGFEVITQKIETQVKKISLDRRDHYFLSFCNA
jgi:Na+/H+ antiporter NhaD/arsenite permease-like protein